MTSHQTLLLLALVAGARARPKDEPPRFSYLKRLPHQETKVRVMHPGLGDGVDVALSDLRALAKEGLIVIDHEDSIFGLIDLTPAGFRAADALGS
jgi:hypothetical protein